MRVLTVLLRRFGKLKGIPLRLEEDVLEERQVVLR